MKSLEQQIGETMKSGRKVSMIAGFAIAVTLIVYVIVVASSWTESRKIRAIIIKCENESIKKHIIQKIEDVALNKFKAEINLRYIEEIAEKNYFVKSATALFSSPETVEVTIEERIPAAILIDRNNIRKISDINGEIVPFSYELSLGELPVIKYNTIDSLTLKYYIKSVIKIMKAFEKFDLPRSLVGIVDCVNNPSDLTIRTRNRSSKLIFNIKENIEFQCLKLIYIIKPGSDIKLLMPGTIIDLRWEDRIITRTI